MITLNSSAASFNRVVLSNTSLSKMARICCSLTGFDSAAFACAQSPQMACPCEFAGISRLQYMHFTMDNKGKIAL